ncbi:MAG TPA: hypothetical protein VHR86_06635 [Armatimonadota bacterium]|nr:hypothetical protein [Armatimonadota bacterium]
MLAAGSEESGYFSLVCGGPLYWLMRHIRLIRQDDLAVGRRVLIAWGITWLPLLILTAQQGTAFGPQVKVPLLGDYVIYGHLFVAVPIFILAEAWIDKPLIAVVREFNLAGLVEQASRENFAAAVLEAHRLCNSIVTEALLLAGAYVTVFLNPIPTLPYFTTTWRTVMAGPAWELTAAGWWLNLVSNPVFLFLLYRWGWKFLVWTWFLWRVAHLRLHLVATHPDRAAGLGFLGYGQLLFGPLLFAVAAVMSTAAANRLIYTEASFSKLQAPLIGFVVLIVLGCLAPLLFFVRPLAKAKVKGILTYTALSAEYMQSFDQKWVGRNHPEEEQLLGSPDIQSLADMGNSFEFVRRMQVVPCYIRIVLALTFATIVPLLPLLLIIMPAVELMRAILTMLSRFIGQ